MTVAINLGRLLMTRGVNDLVADDELFAKFVMSSQAELARVMGFLVFKSADQGVLLLIIEIHVFRLLMLL